MSVFTMKRENLRITLVGLSRKLEKPTSDKQIGKRFNRESNEKSRWIIYCYEVFSIDNLFCVLPESAQWQNDFFKFKQDSTNVCIIEGEDKTFITYLGVFWDLCHNHNPPNRILFFSVSRKLLGQNWWKLVHMLLDAIQNVA